MFGSTMSALPLPACSISTLPWPWALTGHPGNLLCESWISWTQRHSSKLCWRWTLWGIRAIGMRTWKDSGTRLQPCWTHSLPSRTSPLTYTALQVATVALLCNVLFIVWCCSRPHHWYHFVPRCPQPFPALSCPVGTPMPQHIVLTVLKHLAILPLLVATATP